MNRREALSVLGATGLAAAWAVSRAADPSSGTATPRSPAEIANGIYVRHDNGGGIRVNRNDAGEMGLGKKVGEAFGRATIRSMNNDNSWFTLKLEKAGPLTKRTDDENLALVIDGVVLALSRNSTGNPDGTVDLDTSIRGDLPTRKVAAVLGVEPQRRQHPRHRFEVRWSPEKPSYLLGEAIVLKMEIRNTGDTPFAFFVGGKQRGSRDNQFRFLAYEQHGHGKAIADSGDPTNFGGIGLLQTLKPGETFAASVGLDKWFTFTKPDIYRVTGLFEMPLHDPKSTNAQRPIWDDLAVGDCLLEILPNAK